MTLEDSVESLIEKFAQDLRPGGEYEALTYESGVLTLDSKKFFAYFNGQFDIAQSYLMSIDSEKRKHIERMEKEFAASKVDNFDESDGHALPGDDRTDKINELLREMTYEKGVLRFLDEEQQSYFMKLKIVYLKSLVTVKNGLDEYDNFVINGTELNPIVVETLVRTAGTVPWQFMRGFNIVKDSINHARNTYG